jgi:Fe-S-cluster containining protein
MVSAPPAPRLDPVPECKDCGACCAPPDSSSRHYVGLERHDVDRFPVETRLGMVVNSSHLATKKHESGRRVCVAFEGSLGGSCSCSIYNTRPDACRSFERGSEGCAKARSLIGVGVHG